ncbi:MAG: hypothetical protein COY81_03580 [Candidatus Pacebacteria bacterium CG_4_10_14_0_8_um_filter_43_12]|nr:MAG: hypothetical protein COY81_03580 [Candidatus Pacebacteria bacterium CG_4_10_14_0_8_um_filter_43_12]
MSNLSFFSLQLPYPEKKLSAVTQWCTGNMPFILMVVLTFLSISFFIHYYQNTLGLAYNDARSHLDIGRRVVEGLKPGLAQLGSVWLPLTHLLMMPTIWNDFMWHSGLSGAIQSMISYVATGLTIYYLLKLLNVGLFGRIFGVAVFALNLNILYLQSTAMTELFLLGTMTIGVYELAKWYQDDTKILHLIKAAVWVMLSTLIRYDGWFLLFVSAMLVASKGFQKKGYKMAEGLFILYVTLAGLGVVLWILWNWAIFKDPLYFVFGPYSAYQQQLQLEDAGVLATKQNLWLSIKFYWYALIYNSGALPVVFGTLGAIVLWLDKTITTRIKVVLISLLAPLIFNILALYVGHSVLFVQGLSGTTWFNIRYGIMMLPSIAVFAGYLVHKWRAVRPLLVGMFIFVTIFQFLNHDAVTIDDGRVGSSQKNVSQVSNWLKENASNKEGFVLIAAASHDAIIFSSGLPMTKFIHEGTGTYWETATASPDRWARWIVMRTNDINDSTFKSIRSTDWQSQYDLVQNFPFADIYQIKDEYIQNLNTQPILKKQR